MNKGLVYTHPRGIEPTTGLEMALLFVRKLIIQIKEELSERGNSKNDIPSIDK